MGVNDFEVAPVGTRALLDEIGATLRRYEAGHRERAAAFSGEARDNEKDIPPTTRLALRDQATKVTEKAETNARLAGRVEALLAGWEG
jgi:hypothetical protein